MSQDIIDDAVQRHLHWVASFREALAGLRSKPFDRERVRDDSARALGHWFASPDSLAVLGPEFHARAMALHPAFHETAGEAVQSLEARDPPEVTRGLTDALEDLSESLVEFLNFARQQRAKAGRNAPSREGAQRHAPLPLTVACPPPANCYANHTEQGTPLPYHCSTFSLAQR